MKHMVQDENANVFSLRLSRGVLVPLGNLSQHLTEEFPGSRVF
jgi:hypothetical protein